MTRPVSPSAYDSVARGSALLSKSTLLTLESDACQGTVGEPASGRGERAMNRSPIPSVPSHTYSSHSPSFLPLPSSLSRPLQVTSCMSPASRQKLSMSQPLLHGGTSTRTRFAGDGAPLFSPRTSSWSLPTTNSFPDIESLSPPPVLLLSLSLSTPLEILDMRLRWGREVVTFISASPDGGAAGRGPRE